MNAPPATTSKSTDFVRRSLATYQKETGLPLAWWALIALLNFIAQIIFRRELVPGEFGTVNTVLGVIGLMTVPVLALNQAFTNYLARSHAADQAARIESLRASAFLVTETFAWAWGGLCLLLVFLLLPLLDLPRFSLELFTLLNVLIALGGAVSLAVCQQANQLRLWILVAGRRSAYARGCGWGACLAGTLGRVCSGRVSHCRICYPRSFAPFARR